MKTTNLFMINGQPIPAPDAGVGFSFEDLDSDDSGRDESGHMHRFVIRYKVGVWSFNYSSITEEEKSYLETLFADSPSFSFTHPDRKNSAKSVTCEAYRSKYGISWYNAKQGLWKNYEFNIIEC